MFRMHAIVIATTKTRNLNKLMEMMEPLMAERGGWIDWYVLGGRYAKAIPAKKNITPLTFPGQTDTDYPWSETDAPAYTADAQWVTGCRVRQINREVLYHRDAPAMPGLLNAYGYLYEMDGYLHWEDAEEHPEMAAEVFMNYISHGARAGHWVFVIDIHF